VEEAFFHAVRLPDLDALNGRRDWANLERIKERAQAVSQRLSVTVLQIPEQTAARAALTGVGVDRTAQPSRS
jgi:hypothetical protein